jgi:hypothetical protein
MFIINIYLRFALIALGIIGGTIMSATMGFWYGFPFILGGIILLIGYFFLGTVASAGQLVQGQDFVGAENRLKLTFFPKLLYVTNRAMYYIMQGSIATQQKDNNRAEDLFNKALALNLPSDNEKAMVYLQLSNINASKQKWALAKKQMQILKKLKVTQPELKEQISVFEKAMNQSGQIKAQQRMMGGTRGGRMSQGGSSKRRRPKMR